MYFKYAFCAYIPPNLTDIFIYANFCSQFVASNAVGFNSPQISNFTTQNELLQTAYKLAIIMPFSVSVTH